MVQASMQPSSALLAAEAQLRKLKRDVAIEEKRRENAKAADPLDPSGSSRQQPPPPRPRVGKVTIAPGLPSRTPPARAPTTSSSDYFNAAAPARTPSHPTMLGGVSMPGAPMDPRMSSMPSGLGGMSAMAGMSRPPMMPGMGAGTPMGMGMGMMRPSGSKDLPEQNLLLLRELWAQQGYEGTQFVEMQMTIGRELEMAEASRFEREMLTNEIIVLRTELQGATVERNDLYGRMESMRSQMNDVMQAEDRTYNALVSERQAAQRSILEAEEVAHAASLEVEREANKVSLLSKEVAQLEHDRGTAIAQAKRLELRLRDLLAATKPTGGLKDKDKDKKLSDTDSSLGWTQADEDALAAKINERRLAAEEARLAAEEKRLQQEKAKMNLEKNRLERAKLDNMPSRGGSRNGGGGKSNGNGRGSGGGANGGNRGGADNGGYDKWDDAPRGGGGGGGGGGGNGNANGAGGRPKLGRQSSRADRGGAEPWSWDDFQNDQWADTLAGVGGGGWGAPSNANRQGTVSSAGRTPGKRNGTGDW